MWDPENEGTSTWPRLRPLVINVNDEVVISCGSSVSASARGYGQEETYPGETTPGRFNGGSHMGEGGLQQSPKASTYGSVYRPQEMGGGGDDYFGDGASGGGVVRIEAGSFVVFFWTSQYAPISIPLCAVHDFR